MAYSEPAIWPPYAVLGATLASVAIALILCRVRCHPVPAALLGGLAPGAAIFGLCLYLDARLLEGIHYFWIGATLGPVAAFFGLLAAALTVILSSQLGNDTPKH
jgi:hypothetical protein